LIEQETPSMCGQPDAPNEQQATREILLHLRVWLAMRPDSIEEPTSDL
jgi:hypothetical protein